MAIISYSSYTFIIILISLTVPEKNIDAPKSEDEINFSASIIESFLSLDI